MAAEQEAAEDVTDLGVTNVEIILGEKGAYYATREDPKGVVDAENFRTLTLLTRREQGILEIPLPLPNVKFPLLLL